MDCKRARVRTPSHRLLFCLLLLTLCACEGADRLGRLRSALTLTPRNTNTTAWIGYERTVVLTLENRGAVRLHVKPEKLTMEGATPALGLTLTADAALDAIEGGADVTLRVTLAPDAALADTVHDVVFVIPVEEKDVAPARATLHVEVGAPPPCERADPCEIALFDPDTGLCVRTSLPETTPCSDGSECTTADRCSSGRCLGVVRTCDDGIECSIDSCDAARGCVAEPVHDRCSDDNRCTADVCDLEDGCKNPVSPDGTPCGPFSCAQFQVCSLGACTAWPTPEGFPCEDGDLCTVGDTCQAQTCASGDPVEPTAQPPVVIARPTAHVPYDVRWILIEQLTRPAGVPEQIDVPLRFGAVLDVEQGLVGFEPRLVVLWKSAPFGIDGLPCVSWDAVRLDRASELPTFCATAVVATFIDESELRGAERGAEVGESAVLQVAYGTVDAAFVHRALDDVMNDGIELATVESTYFPGPLDPARLVVMRRFSLSLGDRDATSLEERWFYNTPRGDLSYNVHAGLRIAPGPAGVGTALLGWDAPYYEWGPAAGDSEQGAAVMDPEAFIRQTLDQGTILPPLDEDESDTLAWQVLRTDVCGYADVPVEEQAFADVDVALAGDEAYAIGLHAALDSDFDGCGVPSPDRLMAVELHTGTSEVPDGVPGMVAAGLSPFADTLARVHFTYDDACMPDGFDSCASMVLGVDSSPFNHSDPVVTMFTAGIGGVAGVLDARVAALDHRAGMLGAVVAARDGFGWLTLELVEDIDVDATTRLRSETMMGFDAPITALRSPLSPQSVYVVTPAVLAGPQAGVPAVPIDVETDAEGALVRFGCPFPGPPMSP